MAKTEKSGGGMARGIAILAGAAAAGVAAGLTAERLVVGRSRLKPDPFANEPYGKIKGDREYDIAALDGARLFVSEIGPASATEGAIFLHGYSLDHSIWHHQMTGLDGRRRHVFYDARHHGRSVGGNPKPKMPVLAADLKTILDASGLQSCILVGHSMGGMAVLEFCRLYHRELHDRVKGLMLVNTTHTDAFKTMVAAELVGPVERRTRRVIDRFLTDKRSMRMLRLRGDDLSYILVRLFGFGSGASPSQIEHVRKLLACFPSVELVEMIDMFRKWDMGDALDAIDVPTLIVAGGDDRITSLKASKHMAEKIPGARFHEFEGVGHTSMLERSVEFNELFRSFTDEVLGTSGGKRRSVAR
ncbi:MAG: alpha/beta fold hydrolase [Actinomycetota bacterium]|nr:alpha/beta hydrolase [Actinomycetota bacterium]